MDKDNKKNEDEGGPKIHDLTEEQVQEIREVLKKYGCVQFGGISRLDAGEAMYDLGIFRTEAEITHLFNEFGSENDDDDPIITEEHFLHVMTKLYQHLYDMESLREAFKVFDVDQRNYFKVNDLRNIAETLGVKFTDEEANEMFQEMDLDRDGKIKFAEFLQACLTP